MSDSEDYENKPQEEFTAEELILPPCKYEYLDHTADVQIHAWGDSLIEAFEQCGVAMYGYMTEIDKVEILRSTEIEVKGSDLTNLLFMFLDELLYVFSAEEFLVCKKLVITEFNVNPPEGEDLSIKCKCYGEEFTLGKHPQGTEVKAITYASMQIINEPEKNKFEVFVIIDI
ncbi:unnamed protein product [Brassicogethes aeneus]|uniref:Archease domain-containing protein n=1 Tax=Brassicogethes aeneus TaxID=1431903 RepID=A0A9P0B7I8_BRAAE|nr:unnamed protein product [Brassicogethes aeneus]